MPKTWVVKVKSTGHPFMSQRNPRAILEPRMLIWAYVLSIWLGCGLGCAWETSGLFGQGVVSYDGLKVGQIDLAAHPEIKLDTLRPLIVQHEGEPYSTEKVRASMGALYRSGRFNDVQVDVQPEPAGLRVTFILQPAFYVGMINLPGAARVFTYPRLLQVVNIPSQELYTDSRA